VRCLPSRINVLFMKKKDIHVKFFLDLHKTKLNKYIQQRLTVEKEFKKKKRIF